VLVKRKSPLKEEEEREDPGSLYISQCPQYLNNPASSHGQGKNEGSAKKKKKKGGEEAKERDSAVLLYRMG